MGHKKRCNQSELARVLGVTPQTLTKFKHDPSFPPFDRENQIEIYAGCVWWYLRKEPKQIPTDQDLLTGPESDGLERFRQARAAQEEIKLARERGQIVKLNDFEEIMIALLGPYRRIAEHIKRMGNEELWQLIEEANQEVLNGLERLYGHTDPPASDPVD